MKKSWIIQHWTDADGWADVYSPVSTIEAALCLYHCERTANSERKYRVVMILAVVITSTTGSCQY